MRDPQPEEIRVLRALRQINILSGTQFDEARALLEATQTCTRCNGLGYTQVPETEPFEFCRRCDGTGQERVIR